MKFQTGLNFNLSTCNGPLTMKRQKTMNKIVLALSFALTAWLLLLQCYSILALKITRVRLQLSYIASEVLSRNNAIAQLKRMKSR